jgi:MerR family transcriptional regulator, light-induced transcriptional regulator
VPRRDFHPPGAGAPRREELAGREMRDLRPDEAAAMLHVSPDTLRAWEARFGYPHSVSRATGQRRYAHRDVIALRNTLDTGLSVAAAINKARRVSTANRTRRPR